MRVAQETYQFSSHAEMESNEQYFECDRCGACCKGHLLIEADALDVLREPRLIDVDHHHKGKTVRQMVKEIEQEWKAVILTSGGPCPFLGQDNLCQIYPTRPNDCVGMQAGDEQCQECRAAANLPPLLPLAVKVLSSDESAERK